MAEEKAGSNRLSLTLLVMLIVFAWVIAIKSCEEGKTQSAKAEELKNLYDECRGNITLCMSMEAEGVFDLRAPFKLEHLGNFFRKPGGYYKISKNSQIRISELKTVFISFGLLPGGPKPNQEYLIKNIYNLANAFSDLQKIAYEGIPGVRIEIK